MSEIYEKEKKLDGKKILFFSPAFFGYEEKIKKKMIKMGAKVDAYDVRSVAGSVARALLKINPGFFRHRTEVYYGKILAEIKENRYDYVLFIKCDMPTTHILKNYRKCFREARFCLHMWDSIKNIPDVKNKFKYFDYISSFDRIDCQNYPQLHFRPLYYCDEYRWEGDRKEEYKYDLCFIGTIHSDRWKVLKKLKDQATEKKLKIFYYPYLQSKFIYLFYKMTKPEFWGTRIGDFQYDKMSDTEISRKVRESKAIIDIQHPKQTGLTIRTIEMIGMSKKLFTTNKDIKNYDFYNPENICIINRSNPEINLNFTVEYKQIEQKLYNKYYLENWIYEVLGE